MQRRIDDDRSPAAGPHPVLLALLDGTLADLERPLVRADDLGIVRGDGVFDAAIVVRGVPRDLDRHLRRLADSARMLDLPAPDLAGYLRAVDALIAAWDWERAPECVLRMIQTRGPGHGEPGGGWALAEPVSERIVRERETGIRVLVLDRGFEGDGIAELPWLLPGAKSLSYGINMAAKRWAEAHDADDALFVSPTGRLLEGPNSTLVLDLDGVLVTPVQDGILASITLEALADAAPKEGLSLRFAELTRDDLERARGAWLLSSGRIAAPVTSFDGRPIARSPLHEQVRRALDVPSYGDGADGGAAADGALVSAS